VATKFDSIAQYGIKQNMGTALTLVPNVKVTLPPIKSVAKVLKVVIFPNGKEVSPS